MGDIQKSIEWVTDKKAEWTLEQIAIEIGLRKLGCNWCSNRSRTQVFVLGDGDSYDCKCSGSRFPKEEVIQASFPFIVSWVSINAGDTSKIISRSEIEFKIEPGGHWNTVGGQDMEKNWGLIDPLMAGTNIAIQTSASSVECKCSFQNLGHDFDCAYMKAKI